MLETKFPVRGGGAGGVAGERETKLRLTAGDLASRSREMTMILARRNRRMIAPRNDNGFGRGTEKRAGSSALRSAGGVQRKKKTRREKDQRRGVSSSSSLSSSPLPPPSPISAIGKSKFLMGGGELIIAAAAGVRETRKRNGFPAKRNDRAPAIHSSTCRRNAFRYPRGFASIKPRVPLSSA